jgi:hypothetical protein
MGTRERTVELGAGCEAVYWMMVRLRFGGRDLESGLGARPRYFHDDGVCRIITSDHWVSMEYEKS